MSSVSFPSRLKLTSLKSPVLFVTVNGGTLSNRGWQKVVFCSLENSTFKPDKGTDTGGACEDKGRQKKEANKGGPEETGT